MPEPLPIKDGLNPSRGKTDREISAYAFLHHLIETQLRRHPDDDDAGILQRFADHEVRTQSGEILSPDDILAPNDFLWFYRRPVDEMEVPGQLGIVHQDENIVVINKPPFLATMPRGKHITQSAVVKLRKELDNPDLVPAHRLDRHTSGLLLFTTRPDMRGPYQSLFERRKVSKVYRAYTALSQETTAAEGLPTEFLIPENGLYKGSPEQIVVAPTADNPWELHHHLEKIHGRLATKVLDREPNSLTRVTGVELLDSYPGVDGPVLAWRLEPSSGKTHQLRVNMRLLRRPLVHDPMYADISETALWGLDDDLPEPQLIEREDFSLPMGLEARELHFTDPISGETRDFVI